MDASPHPEMKRLCPANPDFRNPGLFLLGLLLLLGLGIGACAFPQISVLRDPLTPEEHLDLGVAYEKKGEFAGVIKEYNLAPQKIVQALPAYRSVQRDKSLGVEHMNRFMVERVIDLNKWLQVYDLEWARACAFGDSTIPLWYTNKAKVWERERDALVCVDDDEAHLRKMDEIDRMWEDRYNV